MRSVFLIFVSLLFSSYPYAQNKIPRGKSPIYLGMSIEDVTKFTGPLFNNCHHCVKGEFSAPTEEESLGAIDVHFYYNRLYKLGIKSEEELNEIVDRFTSKYGKGAGLLELGNGLFAYKWSDGATDIEVRYNKGSNKSFAIFFYDTETYRLVNNAYKKAKK